MTLAIMQPYFFPYIGYFQLLAAVDKFVVFDDVNYINKGWINRNRFLIGSSEKLITLPLQGASQNKKICDIEITAYRKEIDKILRTIEMGYKKAPFYSPVMKLVQDIFQESTKTVSDLNLVQLKHIIKYLDLNVDIVDSSRIYQNEALKGQDRILDICKKEAASVYVNPIGGIELYNRDKFESMGIKLFFLKPENITYKQSTQEFIPWLSIIDVLMFNNVNEVNIHLKKFQLV